MNKIFKNKYKIFNGIINNSPEDHEVIVAGHDGSKYARRENGEPHPRMIHQYTDIINTLSLTNEAVLDFGCSWAHASFVFNKMAPNTTYIGADAVTNVLLRAKEVYEPDYLYKIRYDEPCLSGIRSGSIDVIIVSRLSDWNTSDNFLPEFSRVLKRGGYLFVWSNRGLMGGRPISCDKKKLEIYKYLEKDYKSWHKGQMASESFSKSLWGNKNRYKKLNSRFTEKELRHIFKGLFVKK